jgi:hypothetical protein
MKGVGPIINSKILRIVGANRLPIVKFQLPEHIFMLYQLPTGSQIMHSEEILVIRFAREGDKHEPSEKYV